MSITFNWKKIFLITINIVAAIYIVLAMTAFNTPDDELSGRVCSRVKINIEESAMPGFLDANEIKNILQAEKLYPMAVPMAEINTRRIEETLAAHPFIENAQCYKAQNGHFCISLQQRIPLMRVKADCGDDYYVDYHGRIMPPAKYISNLIVVTGNVNHSFASKVLTPMMKHIAADKFWNNQTVQVNVLDDRTVEIVPRVGDNIIYLGKPTDIERKLKRVETFYKHGLSHAGWNKYSRISVEIDNQIICKRK